MYKLLTFWILITSVLITTSIQAQEQIDEQPRGFQMDKLFTGGSISLGFSSSVFQVGVSPVLGYNVASWVDAGITFNYNYVSFREVYISDPNDKIRRSTYGGGVFTRLFPVRFIFAHAQFEKNYITETFVPGNGTGRVKNKVDANSLLLGAGYTTNRYPGSGQSFFYISLLFDVLGNDFSPYTSATGDIRPIIRAGIQIPLFQNRRKDEIY